MKSNFTLKEIEFAADIYCSTCFHSCDECSLKDFIDFELYNCLERAIDTKEKKDE